MAPSRNIALAPLLAASSSRSEPRPTLTTSKNWDLPPLPRPGRKPANPVESETATRKSQNRDSQREFRKRRQEYVTELEEKVKSEVERAQRVELENEELKGENANLRAIINQIRQRGAGQAVSSSQGAGEYAGGVKVENGNGRRLSNETEGAPAAKRLRTAPVREAARQTAATITAVLSTAFSELDQPHSATNMPIPRTDGRVASCGHCTSTANCFCSEVGFSVDYSQTLSADLDPLPLNRIAPSSPVDLSSTQHALPLRAKRTVAKGSIWAIEPTPSSLAPILCSGDPENCSACRDDPFGKAFCNALSNSVCSTNPCSTCPNSIPKLTLTAPTLEGLLNPAPTTETSYEFLQNLPCCGNPTLCGSIACSEPTPRPDEDIMGVDSMLEGEILPRNVNRGVRTTDVVPCSEAWTVLKCHPNIAFANLQMLADVVAKRTTCDGLSTPELAARSISPLLSSPDLNAQLSHAGLRKKRLTVDRAGVEDALDFLDRTDGSLSTRR